MSTPSPEPFVTVHTLGLSAEEGRIWGMLPTTAHDYPRIETLGPQDSAVAHMFFVLRNRGDLVGARRCALQISDGKYRDTCLALLQANA